MYLPIPLWSHFGFIYNAIAMCLPSTAWAHWDRTSTPQHTRVEVEVKAGVKVALRVGLESSWAVGVGLGSRSGGGGWVGVAWGLGRSLDDL